MKFTTNQKIVGALALICVAPMALALSVYSGHFKWLAKSNHGTLLKPPIELANLPWTTASGRGIASPVQKGKWTLLLPIWGDCSEQCQQDLYKMRQVRLALGKHGRRVERVVVTVPKIKTPILNVLVKKAYTGTRITYAKHFASLRVDNLYITDPHNNVIMKFGPIADGKDILLDMKRLLKASRIG